MTLVNGRGQLGEALSRLSVLADVLVYHTWNVTDKDEQAQRVAYEKFMHFRANNSGRLVLISTSSDKENAYVNYKRKAEAFADGVVRLPGLIGNGICQRFRDDVATEAYGIIDLISIEDAAEAIAAYVRSDRVDVFTVHGIKVPAEMVKTLIRFGAAR